MPRTCFICFGVVGLLAFCIFSVFSGFTCMPSLETICPKYLACFVANLHFEGCSFRFAFLRFVKTKSR